MFCSWSELKPEQLGLIEIQKSAEGIVSNTLITEGQNKSGTDFVQSKMTASDQQSPLPLAMPLDEQVTGNQSKEEPNRVSMEDLNKKEII